MPILDIVQQHIVAADITAVDAALNSLETALATKIRNLTPEERLRYGSINEKNKLLVNKVRDFYQTQPGLGSPDVQWTEFEADFQDRSFYETRINRLLALVEGLTNAKILHDYDNYQNALTDYAYTQYKKDTEAGGYVTKYNELRQFFPNSGGGGNGNGGTGTGTEPPQ